MNFRSKFVLLFRIQAQKQQKLRKKSPKQRGNSEIFISSESEIGLSNEQDSRALTFRTTLC